MFRYPVLFFHPNDESDLCDAESFIELCRKTTDDIKNNPSSDLIPSNLSDVKNLHLDLSTKRQIYYKEIHAKEKHIIIYYLFYPWQGQILYNKFVEKNIKKFNKIGTHVGDWENIVIVRNQITNELDEIFLSRHGDFHECKNIISFNSQGQPEIYISRNTHANYPYTFRLNNQFDTTKRQLLSSIDLYKNSFVSALPDYIHNFKGRWGGSKEDHITIPILNKKIKYKGDSPKITTVDEILQKIN